MPRENRFNDFMVVCTGAVDSHRRRTLATFSRAARDDKIVWDATDELGWADYELIGETKSARNSRVVGIANPNVYTSKELGGVKYHAFKCPSCPIRKSFTDAEMADLFTATRRAGEDSLNIADHC